MKFPFVNPFSGSGDSPLIRMFSKQPEAAMPQPVDMRDIPLGAANQRPVIPPQGGLGGLGGFLQNHKDNLQAAAGQAGAMSEPPRFLPSAIHQAPAMQVGAPGGEVGGALQGLFSQSPQIAQMMALFNAQRARRGY